MVEVSTPRWFYVENEDRLGPVPVEQIAHLILNGGLLRTALVWRHGLPDWTEAGAIPEIATLLPPPLPAGKTGRTPPTPDPIALVIEPDPEPASEDEPKPTPARQPRGRSARAEVTTTNVSDLSTLAGGPGRVQGLEALLAPQSRARGSVAHQKGERGAKTAPVVESRPAPPAPPLPAAAEAEENAAPFEITEDAPAMVRVAWPSGRLADHEFADLVREVHGRRWSGLLTLNHMGVEKTVRIKDGRLVFASSSSHDDRLGELLLWRGRITLDQYVEAGRGIREGKRLGAVLVEMGALDAKELVKVVIDHTQEIIYGAFQWTEGLYHLTETTDSAEPAEPIVLRLSTPDIILEGIRRIDRWSRIARAVGTLESRYDRVDGYEGVLRQMTLSPDKLALLTGLSGVQDVGTICRRSNMPHFDVCRTLWAYRVIGVIRRRD